MATATTHNTGRRRPWRRRRSPQRSTACHACRREFGAYLFPIAAVELTADIHALERAIELLLAVDERHIAEVWTSEDRDAAHKIKQRTISRIKSWLRVATHKLATEYLAPDDRGMNMFTKNHRP